MSDVMDTGLFAAIVMGGFMVMLLAILLGIQDNDEAGRP